MQATTKKHEIIHEDSRYCTLYIWAVVLLLPEQCNNQRPRCDIAQLHATNNFYHG